jgi:hypothetical protein
LSLIFWRDILPPYTIKCKVVLVFNYALCYEDIWGSGGITPPFFLTLAIDGRELAASYNGCFMPGERVPCTHWTGGWMGSKNCFHVTGLYVSQGGNIRIQAAGHLLKYSESSKLHRLKP